MRERFIKKYEELDNATIQEQYLEDEIAESQKEYTELSAKEADLQIEILDITNNLREINERINSGDRGISQEEYRNRNTIEFELENKKQDQFVISERKKDLNERMKDNRLKIAESINKREDNKRKINEILNLQDRLDLEAISLEDSLDNLQYEQGLLSNEKNELKEENKTLTSEEKKIDNSIKKAETKKADLETKKDEIELREVKLDKEIEGFKKKFNTVLENRMKNIAKKRETIEAKIKAAKTDAEKEKYEKELQKNLKENDENNDLFIAVNHLEGIDLLTIPGLEKHLTEKLSETFNNCKAEASKLEKDRTKFEKDYSKVDDEQKTLSSRKNEIVSRKNEISVRNAEIDDLENEVNGEYKEVKNKYNSLRNRSSRCDLAISRILKGLEWDDIHADLGKFKNRDFTSPSDRLSERYVEEEYYVLDNENDGLEYIDIDEENEYEDVHEPEEEVIEEQEPEVIIEDQAIEDVEPENEEEISEEEFDDISQKINKEAERTKLDAEIDNRSQISNPNYFFDSLKQDLQNDLEKEAEQEEQIDEYEDEFADEEFIEEENEQEENESAKAEIAAKVKGIVNEEKLPVPVKEEKVGIFTKIKNWFKSKFFAKQEKVEETVYEQNVNEETMVIPTVKNKNIEEDRKEIDLLSLDDKEFENLLKETSQYGYRIAEKNVNDRREQEEAKKQQEEAEHIDNLLAKFDAEKNARKERLIEKRKELSKEALFRESKKFGNVYANNSAQLRNKLDKENAEKIKNDEFEK